MSVYDDVAHFSLETQIRCFSILAVASLYGGFDEEPHLIGHHCSRELTFFASFSIMHGSGVCWNGFFKRFDS